MKGKKVLIAIIICLFIILIGFAGVYAYIALDIFKTPKQLFGKYLENQVQQVQNVDLGAMKTISENMKTGLSQTEYDMKFNYDEENNAQVKTTLKLDPINSKGMLVLKVNNNDEEIGNYSLYMDKEKIALKIPELNEKYFLIEINTLLEQLQKYADENELTEKKLDLSVEKIEEYEKQIEKLCEKYTEVVKESLTDDKFTTEKNVKVNVDGTEMVANKHVLTLTQQDIQKILKDILTQISEEEILKDFLTDEQISKFKESIDNLDVNEITEEKMSVLKVCIYEKSMSTVKIELQVDDEVVIEYMLTKPSENQSSLIINAIETKKEDGEVGRTQKMVYDIILDDANTTVAKYTTSIVYNKEDVEALKKYYEENEYYYYTDEMIEENYKDTTASQTITSTINESSATSKIVTDAFDNLDIDVSKMQVNYKFGDKVSFDDIKDYINLGEYLDDESKMLGLVMECTSNIQQNPNTLIGMMFNSFNALNGNVNNVENSLFNEDDDSYSTISSSTSSDDDRFDVEDKIESALNGCIANYKMDALTDEEVNIADYLTVEEISEEASIFIKNLELIDGTTLKCTYWDNIYYVKISINAETLELDEVTAYTEEEYLEL